jgi:hypothetical protein
MSRYSLPLLWAAQWYWELWRRNKGLASCGSIRSRSSTFAPPRTFINWLHSAWLSHYYNLGHIDFYTAQMSFSISSRSLVCMAWIAKPYLTQFSTWSSYVSLPTPHVCTSGVPRNFFGGVGGGSTNLVEDRGQREWGSGGGSPLVRGSGGSCNLVQEASFHIVKFS